MTEEISKENSLEYLIDSERICREHCQILLAKVPLTASVFFELRRQGNAKAAEAARIATEKAKTEAIERIGHYRMHSDNLLTALQRDMAYIATEGLTEYKRETLAALNQARAHRREIIAD